MIAGTKTTTSTELTIVGIDPGTTSAVAVLDLDGNLVNVKSAKNFSKDQIIQFIVSTGKPLVIGTDVSNSPSLIEDIASNMGAERCVPSDDLQASYKEQLTGRFDLGRTDAHTTDATAAAEYAYREYADKLRRIQDRAETAGLQKQQVRDVIELVLKQGMATSQAVTEVKKSIDAEDVGDAGENEHTGVPPEQWKRIAEKRQQRINLLTDKIAHLEEYVQTLETGAKKHESSEVDDEALKERNRVIRELRAELDERNARVEELTSKNEALQQAINKIVYEDWTHISQVDDLGSTAEDIVYCDTYRGGDVSNTVDVVVTTPTLKQTPPYQSLQERGIQVVAHASLTEPIDLEQGYVIDQDELVDVIDGSERFMEWLESYRKRQTS